MIWLASFPRSGNTFLRNVLFEVYGIESSTYHHEDYPLDDHYEKYAVIKTHLLPKQVIPNDPTIPVVYLIRDGRDAVVSLAHHKKDILDSQSGYLQNLKEAIIAADGSFFGGWSQNVEKWCDRADIIIRFEDLISDPLNCIERMRPFLNLGQGIPEKLPDFNQLKFGKPKYGSGRKIGKNEKEENQITQKWFRKGVAGNWKYELPDEYRDLFWSYHGEVMNKMGYAINGDLILMNNDFDRKIIKKMGEFISISTDSYKILIESNKLLMPNNDGTKRYLVNLLKELMSLVEHHSAKWNIDVILNNRIIPLKLFATQLLSLENNIVLFKQPIFRKIIFHTKKFIEYILPERIHYELSIIYRKVLNSLRRIKYDKGSEIAKSGTANNIKFENYDLIHIPLVQHYKILENNYQTPSIFTIHDLTHHYFPEFHFKRNIQLCEDGFKFILKNQSKLIAISNSAKEDLCREYSVPGNDIFSIYEAADSKFKPIFNDHHHRHVRDIYKLPSDVPFLLSLSTIEPRKNLKNMILAFNLLISENPGLELIFVIAGQKGWKTRDLKKYVGNNLGIYFTGFIDEAHLASLYYQALALCYVSYYEGFGLPPIEAMACGTPVIYGNNSSMAEVIGNTGLPADPHDVNDIKDKMYQLYSDPQLRKELSKKALKRSFDFSWRKTAIETLDAYKNVISQQSKKELI